MRAEDLAANLRTDRAASAGDEDRMAFDCFLDELADRLDRVATQQVSDIDWADIADGEAAGDDFLGRGDRLDLEIELANLRDRGKALRPGRFRHGEKDLVGVAGLHEPRKRIRR